MNHCIVCGESLLRYQKQGTLVWYCRSCHQISTPGITHQETSSFKVSQPQSTTSSQSVPQQRPYFYCCYRNETDIPQIIFSTVYPAFSLERTVLPGQSLLFSAPINAILEIRSSQSITAIAVDRIPCAQLSLQHSPNTQYFKQLIAAQKSA